MTTRTYLLLLIWLPTVCGAQIVNFRNKAYTDSLANTRLPISTFNSYTAAQNGGSAGATYAGRALLLFDGNSLTQGRGAREATNADDFAAGPYPSATRNALTTQFGAATLVTKNFGVSGQRVTNMSADAVSQLDALFDPTTYDRNLVIAGGMSNDIADEGVSAQTAIDRYVAYCKARRARGFLVVSQTIFPRTTNLPAITAAEFESRRLTVNSYLRLNYLAFSDVLADIAAIPNLSFPDGTHLDAAGYVTMGNYIAGKVAPLLITGFNPQSIPFLLSGATGSVPAPASPSTGTVLLLRGQGANNATTITDDSGHPVTALGNARISTTQFKFGTSSIHLDGSSGTYLTVPGADFTFGVADFTLEAWVYKTAPGSGFPGLFVKGDNAVNQWVLAFPNAGSRLEFWVSSGGYQAQNLNHTTNVPLNQWVHLALVSHNGTRRLYQDGVLAGTASGTLSLETTGGTTPFCVGGFPAVNSGMVVDVFQGYLHARITKSALYTTNFTPPASF